VPSAIVIATDNHRSAFAVNSSESAIMVAVPADAERNAKIENVE
jgi:hypothetical protein